MDKSSGGENRRRLRVLQSIIAVNVIVLLCFVFWIFNATLLTIYHSLNHPVENVTSSIVFDTAETEEDEDDITQTTTTGPWFVAMWILAFIVGMFLITVQLTVDCDIMFRKRQRTEEDSEDDFGESFGILIRRLKLWIKVTGRVLIISTICFSLSLFSRWNAADGGFMLIFGFGGIVLRFLALIWAYQYDKYLGRIYQNLFAV